MKFIKDDNGNIIFIIGKISELLEKGVIEGRGTDINIDKWLVINIKTYKMDEFDIFESAKNFIRGWKLWLNQ